MSILKFFKTEKRSDVRNSMFEDVCLVKEVPVSVLVESEKEPLLFGMNQVDRLHIHTGTCSSLLPICLSAKEVPYMNGHDKIQCLDVTECGKYQIVAYKSCTLRIYNIDHINYILDNNTASQEVAQSQQQHTFVNSTTLPGLLKEPQNREVLSYLLFSYLCVAKQDPNTTCIESVRTYLSTLLRNTTVQYALRNPSAATVITKIPETIFTIASKVPMTQVHSAFRDNKFHFAYNSPHSKCYSDTITVGANSTGIETHTSHQANCSTFQKYEKITLYGLNDGNVVYSYNSIDKKLTIPVIPASVSCLTEHNIKLGVSSKIVHLHICVVSGQTLLYVVTANGTLVQYVWSIDRFELKSKSNISTGITTGKQEDRELTTVFVEHVYILAGALLCAVLSSDQQYVLHLESKQFMVKKVKQIQKCVHVDVIEKNVHYLCCVYTTTQVQKVNVQLQYHKGLYTEQYDLLKEVCDDDDVDNSMDDLQMSVMKGNSNNPMKNSLSVVTKIPKIEPADQNITNKTKNPFESVPLPSKPSSMNPFDPMSKTSSHNMNTPTIDPFRKMPLPVKNIAHTSSIDPFQKMPLATKHASQTSMIRRLVTSVPSSSIPDNTIKRIKKEPSTKNAPSIYDVTSSNSDNIDNNICISIEGKQIPRILLTIIDSVEVSGTTCRRIPDTADILNNTRNLNEHAPVVITTQYSIHPTTTDINAILQQKTSPIQQIDMNTQIHASTTSNTNISDLFHSTPSLHTSNTHIQRDTHIIDRGTSRRRQLDLIAEEISATEALYGSMPDKQHLLDSHILTLQNQEKYTSSLFMKSDAALQLREKKPTYMPSKGKQNLELCKIHDKTQLSWGLGLRPSHIDTLIKAILLDLYTGDTSADLQRIQHIQTDTVEFHGFASAADLQTQPNSDSITCVCKHPTRNILIVGLSSGQLRFQKQ